MNNGNSSETQPGLLNPLTQDELGRLERALDGIKPQWGIAARLMGRLGLRVGEVAKLCWRHVEVYPGAGSLLHVTAEITKTGYARDLPIPSTLCELLIEHRHHAHQRWADIFKTSNEPMPEGDFLTGPVIQKSNGARVSVRWFQIVITNTGRATLGRKIKPHTLRHTFATHLLQQTNIRVVQQALGHRNLNSTAIYTHPTMSDLRDAIEKAGGRE